eukprot:2124723-Prymnesium_polylepis.2
MSNDLLWPSCSADFVVDTTRRDILKEDREFCRESVAFVSKDVVFSWLPVVAPAEGAIGTGDVNFCVIACETEFFFLTSGITYRSCWCSLPFPWIHTHSQEAVDRTLAGSVNQSNGSYCFPSPHPRLGGR